MTHYENIIYAWQHSDVLAEYLEKHKYCSEYLQLTSLIDSDLELSWDYENGFVDFCADDINSLRQTVYDLLCSVWRKCDIIPSPNSHIIKTFLTDEEYSVFDQTRWQPWMNTVNHRIELMIKTAIYVAYYRDGTRYF
jgi:hypothetical protein